MRLLSLRVESYKRFVQPFTLPLARRGLVLIEGVNLDGGAAFDSNRVGKSTLLEPVSWILFNKIPRHDNKRLGADDVCWNGHDADATLEFETSRGQFRARRRRRATGTAASVLTVESLIDTEWRPLSGLAADTMLATGELGQIIGFDYQTFKHAFCLQGLGFGLAGDGYAAQARALEAALRFDVLTQAAKLAHEDVKAHETRTYETVKEMEHYSRVFEDARGTIAQLDTLDESDRETELVDLIAQAKSRIAQWEGVAAVVTAWSRHLEDARQGVADLMAKLDREVEHGRDLDKGTHGQCALCAQTVTSDLRSSLLSDVQARVTNLKVQLTEAQANMKEAQAALTKAEADRDALRAAEREAQQRSRELDDLRTRASRRLTMIESQRQRQTAAEAEIATLTAAVADARRTVQHAKVWDKAFATDIKASVLSHAAPVLNDAARRYGSLLTDGALRFEFDPLRESGAESMVNIQDEDGLRGYDDLSSGEKRRADLIVALALRSTARWRLGEPLSFSLWDEVFDPLDASGLSRALQVLQQDLDELESVFVVTHSATLRGMFPGASVITITREKGQSRVQNSA